jgi:hypothetical protein
MKFTKKENQVLGEVYRRLNYFHKGDLDTNLLLLALPSTVKVLEKYKLLTPSNKELPRTLNWYRLTKKGKEFFKNYTQKNKLTEEENLELFNGDYTKKFDKKLLESL